MATRVASSDGVLLAISACLFHRAVSLNGPANTHYQLHRMVTMPGYEEASKTPMKKRKAYMPSTDELTAMRPAQGSEGADAKRHATETPMDHVPVKTPHASSKGGSQNLGRTLVKISCEG